MKMIFFFVSCGVEPVGHGNKILLLLQQHKISRSTFKKNIDLPENRSSVVNGIGSSVVVSEGELVVVDIVIGDLLTSTFGDVNSIVGSSVVN